MVPSTMLPVLAWMQKAPLRACTRSEVLLAADLADTAVEVALVGFGRLPALAPDLGREVCPCTLADFLVSRGGAFSSEEGVSLRRRLPVSSAARLLCLLQSSATSG